MTAAKQTAPDHGAKASAATILTINAGSSSARLAAYRVADGAPTRLASAHADDDALQVSTTGAEFLTGFLDAHDLRPIDAVCHRVVHGGTALTKSCWLTPAVEDQLRELTVLAPLHNPRAIAWIGACHDVLGATVPQAAAFDTAFFTDLPRVAATYALPRDLAGPNGMRRFGFHGLAHQSMLGTWCDVTDAAGTAHRIITLQLGSGCSIAAISDGSPIDTSMGFTPLEGLVMATRSGDVDPGLLIHLQRHAGVSAADLEHILSHESGLRGLSGRSGDMRDLLAADDDAAALAIEVYCYRARKYIGAYLAAMNGADGILFGGGVGENAPEVRARILAGLDQLGIKFDKAANKQTIGRRGCISAADSAIAVWVAPVDEAAILVDEVMSLMQQEGDGKRHTQRQ